MTKGCGLVPQGGSFIEKRSQNTLQKETTLHKDSETALYIRDMLWNTKQRRWHPIAQCPEREYRYSKTHQTAQPSRTLMPQEHAPRPRWQETENTEQGMKGDSGKRWSKVTQVVYDWQRWARGTIPSCPILLLSFFIFFVLLYCRHTHPKLAATN